MASPARLVGEPHLACAGAAGAGTARGDAQGLQLPDPAGAEAIGWGIGSGFVLAFVVESLLLVIGWVILGGRRKVVKESWR